MTAQPPQLQGTLSQEADLVGYAGDSIVACSSVTVISDTDRRIDFVATTPVNAVNDRPATPSLGVRLSILRVLQITESCPLLDQHRLIYRNAIRDAFNKYSTQDLGGPERC